MKPWRGCYATILVTDIRLDVGSHTIVADSWIIPRLNGIQEKLKGEVAETLSIETDPNECEAWRHLLPPLIERCRIWKHKRGSVVCVLEAQEGQVLFERLSSKGLENAEKELRIDVSCDNTYFHAFVMFCGIEIRPSVTHRAFCRFRSILRVFVLHSVPLLPLKCSCVC